MLGCAGAAAAVEVSLLAAIEPAALRSTGGAVSAAAQAAHSQHHPSTPDRNLKVRERVVMVEVLPWRARASCPRDHIA